VKRLARGHGWHSLSWKNDGWQQMRPQSAPRLMPALDARSCRASRWLHPTCNFGMQGLAIFASTLPLAHKQKMR